MYNTSTPKGMEMRRNQLQRQKFENLLKRAKMENGIFVSSDAESAGRRLFNEFGYGDFDTVPDGPQEHGI